MPYQSVHVRLYLQGLRSASLMTGWNCIFSTLSSAFSLHHFLNPSSFISVCGCNKLLVVFSQLGFVCIVPCCNTLSWKLALRKCQLHPRCNWETQLHSKSVDYALECFGGQNQPDWTQNDLKLCMHAQNDGNMSYHKWKFSNMVLFGQNWSKKGQNKVRIGGKPHEVDKQCMMM